MGSANTKLSAPLYDSLGVARGEPVRFRIGGLTVEVPASNFQRRGCPTIRRDRRPQLEATLPAWVLQRYIAVIVSA